jgi:hypothetical protein
MAQAVLKSEKKDVLVIQPEVNIGISGSGPALQGILFKKL